MKRGVAACVVLGSALYFACTPSAESGDEGETTSEEVRDEVSFVLARCSRVAEPLADRGSALDTAEVSVTLGKRGGKRNVTLARISGKGAGGKSEGSFKVVAHAATGAVGGAYGTFVFVGSDADRGKLKVNGKSSPISYLVAARLRDGRSYVELGTDARDALVHAPDCVFDPKAWRVIEDPSCLNLLGGKKVEGKLPTIPERCLRDIDYDASTPMPNDASTAPPPADAATGTPHDAGAKGDGGTTKDGDPPLPKWPDPSDQDEESPAPANDDDAEPIDAGAEKKKAGASGGCLIASTTPRTEGRLLAEGGLLAIFAMVVAVARRRTR